MPPARPRKRRSPPPAHRFLPPLRAARNPLQWASWAFPQSFFLSSISFASHLPPKSSPLRLGRSAFSTLNQLPLFCPHLQCAHPGSPLVCLEPSTSAHLVFLLLLLLAHSQTAEEVPPIPPYPCCRIRFP